MTTKPISEDQRILSKHYWAVRVNLPTNARHVATLARRLLDSVRYARLEVPAEVAGAVEVLEGYAAAVDQRVKEDQAKQQASGLDDAHFMRQLEDAYYASQAAAAERGQ